MQNVTRLSYYLVILLTIGFSYTGSAQESMMPEVSPEYLQRLVDTAKKYHPRMETFDHRAIIADENIKKAKASWLEPLTFSYVYSPNNSSTLVNPSFLNGYQFGLYLNVASFFTRPHSVKQAKEELKISKLDKTEYARNLEAEVKARYYRYLQAVVVLRIRKQAAVDAENILKQVQHKFEKSEDSYENFNKFSVAYADRRQAAIESEGTLLIAKSYLEELLGKKIEDIN
ncbi:MAG: TolC family protein [Sediminibacterium sp.]|nr:TolC family protein [Sediminibacterium sp.]